MCMYNTEVGGLMGCCNFTVNEIWYFFYNFFFFGQHICIECFLYSDEIEGNGPHLLTSLCQNHLQAMTAINYKNNRYLPL